jgi:hypothetical protein
LYLSLAHGGSFHLLTARNAVELGIIPSDSMIGPPEPYAFLRDPQENWSRSPQFRYGIGLFTIGDNEVAIGEVAWGPAVKAMLAKYRPIANVAEIDLPDDDAASPSYKLGRFVMVFDRERLARAAKLASSSQN